MTYIYNKNELYHFGILGQKWGIRRYQNSDGSLTEAGKKRYYNPDGSLNQKGLKRQDRRNKGIREYNDMIDSLNENNRDFGRRIANYKKFNKFNSIFDDVDTISSKDGTFIGYKNRGSNSTAVYATKKEAADAYMHELEGYIKSNSERIQTYRDMTKKLKNADISEDTFFEKADKINAIGTGIASAGFITDIIGGVNIKRKGAASLSDFAIIGAGATAFILGTLMDNGDVHVKEYEKQYAK